MTGDDITLTCPLCATEHRYPVVVERSLVFGGHSEQAPERIRSFVRLFTCPSTGGQFQAMLRLPDSPASVIHRVEIGDAR